MLFPIIFFAFCVLPTYTFDQKKTIITHILENNKNCTFPPKEILQKLSSCDRPKPDEKSIDSTLDFTLYMCLELLDINKQLCGESNWLFINSSQFNSTLFKFQPDCNEIKQNLNSTSFKQFFQNYTQEDYDKFCTKYKSEYMIKLLVYGNKQKNEQKLLEQLEENSNKEPDKTPKLQNTPETSQSQTQLEKKKEIEKIPKKEKILLKPKVTIEQHPSSTISPGLGTINNGEEEQQIDTKENSLQTYKEDNKDETHDNDPQVYLPENDNMENTENKETEEKIPKSSSSLQPVLENENLIEDENKDLIEDQEAKNFDSLDNNQQKLDTEDDERNNKQEIHSIYPYEDTNDSHFFTYFFSMIIFIIGAYLIFHNKQKIMALALEGRSKRMNRRRPSTASYRKLESNLEEAITSNCSQSVANVIY